MQTKVAEVGNNSSNLEPKTNVNSDSGEGPNDLLPAPARFQGLDFLRAFALLMGVLLHSVSMYLEPADGSEPRAVAGIIFVWIHTWRMPLFMLLAGFFTALSLTKRSPGEYFVNRVIRLGTPLLILWLAIPAVDEADVPMFALPDILAFALHGELPNFRLDHLWFLYYLLIFYVVMMIAKVFLAGFLAYMKPIKLRFISLLLVWFPILVFLAPAYKPVGGIFSQIPTNFGDMKFGSLLFLASFFIMGVQVFHSREFQEHVKQKRFHIPSLVVFSLFPIAVMGWGVMKDEPFTFESSVEMWMVHAIMTASTLFLTMSMVGFAEKYMTSNGPIVTWLVRLSYPIYVFHLAFVFGVGGYLAHSGWGATPVILASVFCGLLGPTVIYYVFIKYTPLDWVFNGYKRSFFQLKNDPRFVKFL